MPKRCTGCRKRRLGNQKKFNHKERKGHKVGARFIAPSNKTGDRLTAKNAENAKLDNQNSELRALRVLRGESGGI